MTTYVVNVFRRTSPRKSIGQYLDFEDYPTEAEALESLVNRALDEGDVVDGDYLHTIVVSELRIAGVTSSLTRSHLTDLTTAVAQECLDQRNRHRQDDAISTPGAYR